MRKFQISFYRGIVKLFALLPLKCLYKVGDFIAWFLRSVLKYRYATVAINLARSFPEKKCWEIEPMIKDFYKHLGEVFAETIWVGGRSPKALRKQHLCEITNPEVLNKAYENAPNVAILNSHCGNWEIYLGMISYNYHDDCPFVFDESKLILVYKELHNKVWDEVFKRNRFNPVPKNVEIRPPVESSRVLRYAFKNKDNKLIYAFPADQYPYEGAFHLGEFLHQNTYAMKGSMGVAQRLGMAVVYMRMERVERGHYKVTYVNICDDASKFTPEEILKMYYTELEKEIKDNPTNWLWSHKRWK